MSYGRLIGNAAGLCAALLACACGDGSTEPSPQPPATTLTVVPGTAELTALGATLQFTARVLDQNGRVMAGAVVAWSSGDTSVATVDASGLAAAVNNGTAAITATSGSASGSAAVTVAQAVSVVTVSHTADTLAAGDTLRLSAEASDANGHPVANAELEWSTSDATVATVDSTGLVRAVAAGTAVIAAAAAGADGAVEVVVRENGDRAALVALYESTDGPNWTNNGNWLTDRPPGEWHGVEVDGQGRVTTLELHGNNLSGPIPAEIGTLARLEVLWLPGNALSGSIPAAIGDLARLKRLDLGANSLSGGIPAQFGDLRELTFLNLRHNNLDGPVPPSLAQLNPFILDIDGNSGICVPGTSVFSEWLERVRTLAGRDVSADPCNAADVAALRRLYEATGGEAWTESAGWTEEGAVDDWHGVTTDSLGRVTILDLTANGLFGRLPGGLGSLAQMTELRIADNADLSGRFPLTLALLSLRTLHYFGTGLCAPPDASFRSWLSAIPSHKGTGVECGPLSDREALEALYHATGGPDWQNQGNWLTDAPLGEWHGVDTDDNGRVTVLELAGNNLTGPLAPEIGALGELRLLALETNALRGPLPPALGELSKLREFWATEAGISGPIPPELGQLSNLEVWHIWNNGLTGSIPAELGNLSSLRTLGMGNNNLTGPIPPEFGRLSSLEFLYLHQNALTGPIPPEFGRLSSLFLVWLTRNALTGPLPREIGDLASLEHLHLERNRLSGPVPPELGRLGRLKVLGLSQNTAMTGPLPPELTALPHLSDLLAGGTGLCTPSDPAFVAWLESVVINRRVARCASGPPSAAYLVQSVQSREHPVPLVAGQRALLRAFPTATRATSEGIPDIRARFYVDGREVHVSDIPGKPTPIPTAVDEASLSASANAEIPGDMVRPGLEMVIEVDPDGELDPALGVARRIPETGRLGIDVQRMPPFDLTLVPFLWTGAPEDSSIVAEVESAAADPDGHVAFSRTRTWLPVDDFEISAHAPVLSSSNNSSELVDQVEVIWALEGGTGYYMATMAPPITGSSGSARTPGRASFSLVPGPTLHELGHNMSLRHAPCGNAAGPDPSFPTTDASIGVWGYDFDSGELVGPRVTDIMSYCGGWISDYHFTKALRYRLANEGRAGADAAAPVRSLLLWGGVGAEGEPYLEPAFVVDAPALLPDSAGAHRISGRTADGGELFALSFTMPETVGGDGGSGFVFVLPARPGWEEGLASLVLAGPGGTAILNEESNRPIAILRNPLTGRVRGILREPPGTAATAEARAALPLGSGLEVLFSRGIPDAEAWNRRDRQ